MAVRNWWVKAYVDGRAKPVTFGPRGKDGGFGLTIYQRKEGKSMVAGRVYGYVDEDGLLHLDFWAKESGKMKPIGTVVTRR